MTNIHNPNPEGKKINLNKASLEELEYLPMMGRERAERLIKYRDEHGPFKSWDDVDKISGFSLGMIEDMKAGGATIA